ncbi:transglycosylase SLT domain-containing protein [Streptomyces antarcticus]|uniref:transglycosylase SLT domain-containing protein n=1 Tax=Streptomyces antarcticus TaxID=2996458 RepID=UPI002271CA67|nr:MULTISPECIES: transglycosylase SLT domain-containing protein [unclassified Streptomyces]MCY0941913.1 transglycosylase SLT domain-containing protein [Streptomyces sp. H34-AA3]MCZ4082814.1 transglycosylase SLT domain-containing protein [Streptomyces sp. H34-S5]
MAEARGPIKVGTGYIEIIPKILQKDIEELRRKVSQQMQQLGATASKEVSKAVKDGLAGLPKETQKQAKKAKEAVEAEALDTAKTLKKIEKQITREFGEEAALRFREFRKAEEKKRRLLEETSAATRTAVRDTVRVEERAARERQTVAERLERERRQLLVQTQREHDRIQREQRTEAERQARLALQGQRTALREQVAAQRAATAQIVASIREQAVADRASLQDRITGHQRNMVQLRDQIRDVNRDINSTNLTTQSYFTRTGTSLRKMGTWFDQVGMSITEAGNILSTRFLAPLTAAGAALTAIGVENADKRLLGQLGLSSAGVSKSESAKQMKAIQNFAIDTPFSIDIMHEYQMKLIRSVAGSDKNWYSKDATKRTGAANNAAGKTTDLIMAIGDSMARAGNLNPQQFQRAMYAMDMIMDMDRAPTKNVKQLAAASGMPASELAQLLGFKDSQEMWKIIGTPAKDGGGVSGTQIMNSMLNYWNPEKYGKKYGPMTSDGSVGFAKSMTSATITGRVQQMKERASFELGNLFVEEGKEGQYQYTDLGNKIAGEDGILDQVKGLAVKWGPKVDGFLELFLHGVETFISTLDRAATWIQDSGLAELAKPIAEFLIKWGPLILAVGLLSKVLGKAVGLVGRAFTPAAAVMRGGVRAYEAGRDTRSQRAAARTARQESRAAGGSRRDARQAGREAYREQRTANRNGDSRSNGQRVWDGLRGRDSREADGQRQIRALEEQIREARDQANELRDELREVNRESLRQITQALAGGSNSVQGAANQAQTAVNSVQTQAQQVNNSSLDHLRQEVEKVEKATRELVTKLGSAKNDVDVLNGKNLNTVTSEFSALRSAAEEAGRQITSDNARVGNLNDKRVSAVTASINELRDAANRAADQIGDGAMSASTSGRTANLNKRRLTDIIEEFRKLFAASHDVFEKIGQGTGATNLAGRIGLLNGRSLKDVKGQVDDLGKSLNSAKGHAEGLDGSLGEIGKKAPGGGGSGGGKKHNARGGVATKADVSMYGVMPGYAPWVDNIPAVLSPGEAVLRPEVTNALGESTINSWNALAIRGKLSRHARGTSGGGGKLDLEAIKNMVDLQNIYPVGTAMLKTMKLHGSSDPLGGPVQGGIQRTGDGSSRLGGSVASEKFRGMYNWMTDDVFDLLRKVPTLVGQAAGVLGGALAPVQADYFWDDVWRGDGNIIQRGKRYMGHMFSMETLGKVWDNLYSGVDDSLGAIWDLASDPIGAFTDAFGGIGDVVSGSYNNIVGMIETVKEIKDSPMGYAGRVYGEFMANAQESMPNTTGLFDFKNGSTVQASMPDFAAGLAPKAGTGGAGQWAPTALQAMSMLGIPSTALQTILYRIGMESGGDPTIVNKWDSNWHAGYPSVGLMQVIGPTFDAYAGPFRNSQPKLYGTSINPLANIYAGLNYATQRYGSGWMRMLAGNTGYATGTMSASPGFAMVGEKGRELVQFGGGERVYNNQETEAMLNGKKYEIHVHEARNEPTAQAVMRALQTAEALYSNL